MLLSNISNRIAVQALRTDWQLVGRSLYLGLKNLTTNPLQASGSLLMGIGSELAFTPKTLIGFSYAVYR